MKPLLSDMSISLKVACKHCDLKIHHTLISKTTINRYTTVDYQCERDIETISLSLKLIHFGAGWNWKGKFFLRLEVCSKKVKKKLFLIKCWTNPVILIFDHSMYITLTLFPWARMVLVHNLHCQESGEQINNSISNMFLTRGSQSALERILQFRNGTIFVYKVGTKIL